MNGSDKNNPGCRCYGIRGPHLWDALLECQWRVEGDGGTDGGYCLYDHLKKLIGGATKKNLLELRICAVRYDAAAWCRGTYFALLPA
jgi:hypothetical protein